MKSKYAMWKESKKTEKEEKMKLQREEELKKENKQLREENEEFEKKFQELQQRLDNLRDMLFKLLKEKRRTDTSSKIQRPTMHVKPQIRKKGSRRNPINLDWSANK